MFPSEKNKNNSIYFCAELFFVKFIVSLLYILLVFELSDLPTLLDFLLLELIIPFVHSTISLF
jgi:hypothetical protein